MQHRVSSQDFTEYLAYFSIEPWKSERLDINNAVIATLLANAHRDSKTKPQPFSINDFKIDYWKKIEAPIQHSNHRLLQEMEQLGRIMGQKRIQGDLSG